MAERPILFSGQMVRAILDGRKTQTRRVVKPPAPFAPGDDILVEWATGQIKCPYGQPGDLLWVRETWAANRIFDDSSPRIVGNDHHGIWWKADHSSYRPLNAKPGRWRPSIHMPRWASRITLEVTGVQVEQLQEITTEDALAEGIAKHEQWTPRVQFSELWDSINAKRGYGWNSNPCVWVVEFKKVED